jgi:hypothetical protein
MEDKKFSCDKCDKHFALKQHLENHMRKKNLCDRFVKNTININNRENDMINNEDNINKIDAKTIRKYLDEFKCAYCKKQFTQKCSVLYHIKNNCKEVKEINKEKICEIKKSENNDVELKNSIRDELYIKMKEEFDNKFEFLEKKFKTEMQSEKNKNKALEKKLKKELSEMKILKKNFKTKITSNDNDSSSKNDLIKKKYQKNKINKKFRMMVWDEYIGFDNGKSVCHCCEETEISQMNFVCGHIVAEANGGKIEMSNLLPICASCNEAMGTENLFEFQDKLKNFK